MDSAEWVLRYVAHMVKAGIAVDVAQAAADESDHYDDVEPEVAADDELSYWLSES